MGEHATRSGVRTVAALVDELARRLAGVDSPRRDASDLVAALLDEPKHWALVHEGDVVTAGTWRRACDAADQIAHGMPIAYAVGRASFRQFTLDVDERVLIPRPETELIVDLVLERCARGGTVVDVGTGSGAIAIALAVEGDFDCVVGTDISSDALDVARANATRYAARARCGVTFAEGDLLSPFAIHPSLHVVVSNPPYISFSEIAELPVAVRNWEPGIALLSAGDGMTVTRRLIGQAADRLAGGGLLAMEVDARRALLVAELVASDARYHGIRVHLDLTGRERFVLATRTELS